MSALASSSVHSVASCFPGGHTIECMHRQLLYAVLEGLSFLLTLSVFLVLEVWVVLAENCFLLFC